MKKTALLLILFLSFTLAFTQDKKSKKATASTIAKNVYPNRIPRDEAFFGLHFDFHANDKDKAIGKDFSAALIDSMLKAVKPDYVQVDCKGHRGFSSYPTKVGIPAPGIVADQLKIWREVTAKNGVTLIVHFSGVYDVEAIRKHPEWARIDAKGNKDTMNTSLHSAYVDQSLIPQLKELSKDYGIDGCWIDGDCWAVFTDYSEAAMTAFTKETGITNIPRSPKDENYDKYVEFTRKSFRKYVDHYADAIHAVNPNFKVASNWAFTSMMPEKIDVSVDYLSGDFFPNNSLTMGAFEARCIAPQGKPWDIMSWGFTRHKDQSIKVRSTKMPAHLRQESAHVLAMGGGYCSYFKQNRDASIQANTIGAMKGLAEFCRARQPFCHKATAVPQVALLYSVEGFKKKTPDVYRPWNKELKPMVGVMSALLDGQHSVEILMDHTIKGRMKEYGLIVIPEWEYINPELKDELSKYVYEGGSLMVIGAEAVKNFEKELGVTLDGTPKTKELWLQFGENISGITSTYQPVKLLEGTKTYSTMLNQFDERSVEGPAATIANYGKGKIAGVYVNIGDSYNNYKTPGIRKFIDKLGDQLFTDAVVQTRGTHMFHVATMKKDGKLMVNLINTTGPHNNDNVFTYEEIPAVGPITMMIKHPVAPGKVTLQPDGEELEYTYDKGVINLIVPKLRIHSIVVVE